MKRLNHFFKYFTFIGILLLCNACTGFRFTFSGVNLDPNVKTFSVETFDNRAPDGPSNMGIVFSDGFRDYMARNTPLTLVPQGEQGDLQFEGTVTGYRITPISPGASELENADFQRLTITVKVNFVNNYDDQANFDQNFSFYFDFEASQNITSVEAEALDVIFEQIYFDVFNASVATW
ncbi:LPS assembly lipoprotein LptE [Sediminitomix flava]|nr:LptE family protein [Sediminitomix flava]